MLMALCLMLVADDKPPVAARGPDLYPHVEIAHLAKWVRPRATIQGKVTLVKKEADGDIHFRVEDADGSFAVCEIIPEMPMPNGHPRIGDKVSVRGVARWDGEHKWPELHPVVEWRPLPKK